MRSAVDGHCLRFQSGSDPPQKNESCSSGLSTCSWLSLVGAARIIQPAICNLSAMLGMSNNSSFCAVIGRLGRGGSNAIVPSSVIVPMFIKMTILRLSYLRKLSILEF